MQALTAPTIFTAVDKFSGTVIKMSAGVSSFASKSQASFARMSLAAQRVGQTAKTIGMNAGMMGLAIAAPLAYAAKEAIHYEQGMAKINTLADLNKAGIAAMGKQLLDITRKIPVTLDDVQRGLYIINSGGIKGAQGLDMVTNASKLAVAGLGSVEQASHLMSSVFTVFGDEGNTAAEIYNKLALVVKLGKTRIDQMSEGFGKASIVMQLAGVSLNEFLAGTAALTVKGSSAAEAYTQLTGAAQAMLKPTSVMLKAFHNLGVTGSFAGQKLIKQYGGLVPAMDAVNHSLDKLGLKRAKAWGRLGGYIAQAALTPGGKANGHFVDNQKVLATQPNAGNEMYAKMLGTTSSQFTILQNNLKAFAIVVGTTLLPTLTKLMQKISPIIDSFITWTENNPGLTQTIVKIVAGIAGFLLVLSPVAMTVGLIADAFAAWASVMAVLDVVMAANPIAAIIIGIVALIALVAAIVRYWDSWGAALSMFLGPLGLVIGLVMAFKDNWGLITKAFKEGGILSGLKMIGKVILDVILYPIEQLLSIIGKLTNWDWAAKAAKGLHDFRVGMGVNVDGNQGAGIAGTGNGLAGGSGNGPRVVHTSPVLIQKWQKEQADQQQQMANLLTIDILNPGGAAIKHSMSGPMPIPVKTTPTIGQR